MDNIYPLEHEEKVIFTLDCAMQASASFQTQKQTVPIQRRPFRILEVGIGTNCRTIQRGLYDQAFMNFETNLSSSSSSIFHGIEIVGMDIV